eukprot:scaffold17065_cov85-Skeletonema_dohrnii-CCMP3373.AAC.3
MKLQTITQATIVSHSILLTAAAGSIRGSDSGRVLGGLFGGSTRIIGGEAAIEDRYPYAVSLSNDDGHFCGGSLIARDVVLSAAHCDEQGDGAFMGSAYKAVVGRHAHVDNDGQELSVRQALPHPNYDSVTTDNDFMLIFLNEAASDTINIVKLNTDAATPDIGSAVTVMGWGDIDPTDDGQVFSSELMEVEVNTISNEECDDSSGNSGSYQDSITSNMLCAREEGGGEDSCQGDSGGPLVIRGADLNGADDTQVGVVSWGIGCARADYPGVYARISSQYEWVRSELCARSNFAPLEFDCSNAAPPSTTTSSESGGSSVPSNNNDNDDDDWNDDNTYFPTMQPTQAQADDDWSNWTNGNDDDWNDDNTYFPTMQPTQI